MNWGSGLISCICCSWSRIAGPRRNGLYMGTSRKQRRIQGNTCSCRLAKQVSLCRGIKVQDRGGIAHDLLQCILLFGAPKELIWDQGKEFLKQIVEQLCKAIGMERKVPSGYHPRTKGLTERFNQTLIQTPSRDAEAEPKSRRLWIRYGLRYSRIGLELTRVPDVHDLNTCLVEKPRDSLTGEQAGTTTR